jgi:oligopeptide/dipeptide ABC transporter ATP-binding protein
VRRRPSRAAHLGSGAGDTEEFEGLRVRGLTIVYGTEAGELAAVRQVDLDLQAGTITGLVGESGSGKSTLALAMLNAVPSPGRITAGSVTMSGIGDITRLRGRALREVRGGVLGYVFQASQNSLNPLKRVGAQLLDLARSHGVPQPRLILGEAQRLCERMGLDATRVLSSYQHELSGGMRQRVGIVFALVLNAKVLILDEPTTALDMLSQAAVLQVVREIHAERRLATVVITHDIAVVAEMADRVVVTYAGRIVESGATGDVLRHAAHPYTRALLRSIPRISGDISAAEPLPGRPPDLASIPTVGCVFRARCPLALPICSEVDPATVSVGPGHATACHLAAGPLAVPERTEEVAR